MKKILSLVLALVMVLGCMTVTAFAYENVRGDESTINSLTLAVGDVIPVTKDLVDEEDKVTNLKFYNLDTTWTAGATEKVFNGNVPESYCISKQYPSCPSTGVLLVTKAWDETDKTIELAFYASQEDVPAAPSGKSGSTTITATVTKPEVEYEIVIPQDVTMDEAGVEEIGAASISTAAGKLKNATANTVISYTASGTNFTLTGGSATMAATYYTDSEGKTALTNDAIVVYQNGALVDPLTKLYVGVSQTDWDAAAQNNPGTYTASVTYNFSAEEVEKVTIADILPEEFPVSADSWWFDTTNYENILYVQDGNLIAQYEELSISVPVITILTPTGDSYTYTDSGVTWTFTMKEESWNSSITISGCTGSAAKLNGDYTESM